MSLTFAEVTRSAGEFFMKRSPIHEAGRRITSALDALGIDAVVGMAIYTGQLSLE